MFCSGQSHRKVIQLHDKYGSIVRLGPNELSYIVPEAWDAIMGRRKGEMENPKAPWYCSPEKNDIVGAPPSDHTRMRRILSHSFSAGAMIQQQPLITGHVDLLIQRLHEGAKSGGAAINIGNWYHYCLFDIIGDLSFGEPFGCLQESAMHPWIQLIFANIRTTAIAIAFNRFPLLRASLPWFVPKKLQQQADDWMSVSRDKVAKRLAVGKSRPDFIQTMISSKGGLVRRSQLIFSTAHSCAYSKVNVNLTRP